jgi:hypothetical protein
MPMTRLVQIRKGYERHVAIVEEPKLRLLAGISSIYELAQEAISSRTKLSELAHRMTSAEALDYDLVYGGRSDWRILQPIDVPSEPARLLISGTGLTHLGSARDRQGMHAQKKSEQLSEQKKVEAAKQDSVKEEQLTDSMKMFRWGVEGGKPAAGHIGNAPEWFYKGTGTNLRAHAEPLEVPPFGEDGGEEGEIAGVYLIGPDEKPRRIGMACGNEFSDHRFERKNYLNLAGSKLRTCALGPELVVDPDFESVPGEVRIERDGGLLWSKKIRTGEAEMCHSLRNIEHHHFKYAGHRQPGDVHVHFFGADCLSFGEGVELKDGDVMSVRFEGFGRALVNPLRVAPRETALVTVTPLG